MSSDVEVVNEPHNQQIGLPAVFTKNFGVTAVMKTSVLLTWEVPESYKSEVPLKVSSETRGATGQTAPPSRPACCYSMMSYFFFPIFMFFFPIDDSET